MAFRSAEVFSNEAIDVSLYAFANTKPAPFGLHGNGSHKYKLEIAGSRLEVTYLPWDGPGQVTSLAQIGRDRAASIVGPTQPEK